MIGEVKIKLLVAMQLLVMCAIVLRCVARLCMLCSCCAHAVLLILCCPGPLGSVRGTLEVRAALMCFSGAQISLRRAILPQITCSANMITQCACFVPSSGSCGI